jgi:hypothetical protein
LNDLVKLINEDKLNIIMEKANCFDSMYEKALAQVNRHAWRYKKEEPGSSGGRSEVSKIRLPEIPLATFHGNPNEWVCYKERFQALIAEHLDLSDPQKLTYLRNLL